MNKQDNYISDLSKVSKTKKKKKKTKKNKQTMVFLRPPRGIPPPNLSYSPQSSSFNPKSYPTLNQLRPIPCLQILHLLQPNIVHYLSFFPLSINPCKIK